MSPSPPPDPGPTLQGAPELQVGDQPSRPMPSYLVTGRPKPGKLVRLRRKLDLGDLALMRGFGESLEFGLKNARRSEDGSVLWEQKSDSRPPLAQERAAILDEFFREVTTERVVEGAGWAKIRGLRPLWNEREG